MKRLQQSLQYGKQKITRTKVTSSGTNTVKGRIRRAPAS